MGIAPTETALVGDQLFTDIWGGNLMNMTVQYNPLYAEKGISFTGGICLKL